MMVNPHNRVRKYQIQRFPEMADFASWMLVISSIGVALLYVLGDIWGRI